MAALFGFGKNKGHDGAGDREEPRFKDPAVLSRLIEEKNESYLLVDVRTPEEYVAGHITSATRITHTDIANTPPTEDKDARIILYCRSGNRSEQARRVLLRMGYQNVTNFGGVIHWPGPLVSGSDPE